VITAFRALISTLMLFDFYVIALAQIIAIGLLTIWLSSNLSGPAAIRLGGALLIFTVGAVGYGTWKAICTWYEPMPGVPLTRADAPALWRLVDELAAAAATRPPDEIILIPQVNAAVSERTVLMGLISRRRYLYIGLPLLMTLTVAQVRAVLGHEFGHYSGRHTRLSAISYRGGLVIAQTVTSMSRRNVAGWMFRAYARLYWIAQSSVRRLQEREADLLAAQVGGREAARSALIEVEVIGQAFAFFLEQYVRLGMGSGLPSR